MSESPKPPSATPEDDPGPIAPAESSEGVDLTLIRELLSLTPAERLERLQRAADSLVSLRNDVRRG